MANDTTKSPWIIDTASATPIAAAGMRLSIRVIRWVAVEAAVANQSVVVQDGNARNIWESGNLTATAAGKFLVFEESRIGVGGEMPGENFISDGLTVPTLPTNTKLYIYFS